MRASLLCLLAVVAAASADNASQAAAGFVANFKQSLRELSSFDLSNQEAENVYDALLLSQGHFYKSESTGISQEETTVEKKAIINSTGALMKLATIQEEPGNTSKALVDKYYQLITRSLFETFPEHKKKIQKLSQKHKKFVKNQRAKKRKLSTFLPFG